MPWSGSAIAVAPSGREALDHLGVAPTGEAASLVILDLVMPELDGIGGARAAPRGGAGAARDRPDRPWRHRRGGHARCGPARSISSSSRSSHERLQVSIENALKLGALEGEIARLKRSASGTLSFADIVTTQPGDGAGDQPRQARRAVADPDPGRGRIRRRQGADRPRHPGHQRPQGQALRHGQLRRRCPRPSSNRSSSATRRAPSPAPRRSHPASSARRTRARSSSTRSASCRRRPGQAACGRCRTARSTRSARGSRSASTSG